MPLRNLVSKDDILGKINRFQERLDALSKRYEWTLSAEEVRSKKRLQSAIKKLNKQLKEVSEVQRTNEKVDEDDTLTMTTMSSSDTLSTMCSGIETQTENFCRNYTPMMPLIPPTPTKNGSTECPAESPLMSKITPHEPPLVNVNTSNDNDSNLSGDDNNEESRGGDAVTYKLSIPKSMLHGLSFMFLIGIFTKWYISRRPSRN